jgi:hypothetical protein
MDLTKSHGFRIDTYVGWGGLHSGCGGQLPLGFMILGASHVGSRLLLILTLHLKRKIRKISFYFGEFWEK